MLSHLVQTIKLAYVKTFLYVISALEFMNLNKTRFIATLLYKVDDSEEMGMVHQNGRKEKKRNFITANKVSSKM